VTSNWPRFFRRRQGSAALKAIISFYF
jgi:hypothetical protein